MTQTYLLFYGKVRYSFFLSSSFILRFALSLSFLRNRSLFGLFSAVKWFEVNGKEIIVYLDLHAIILNYRSIAFHVEWVLYARNWVCRPLTISSPLNIYWIVQYSSPLCFSIDRLISKTGKHTGRNENATMKLTHIFQLLFM